MDFVTALPFFNSYTVILTMVDCFSKMSHFVPLPKLPSTKETANWWSVCVVSPPMWSRTGGHSLLLLLKGVLESVVGYCQFVHRIPSTVQWTRNEDKPGHGDRPSFHGVSRSLLLVPQSCMCGICAQLPDHFCFRAVTLSLCVWLSDTFVACSEPRSLLSLCFSLCSPLLKDLDLN